MRKLLHIYFLLILSIVMLNITQASLIPSAESLTYTTAGTLHANFIHTPLIPYVNDTVTFDASTSTSGNGYIISYEWSFGDSTSGTGMVVNKVYEAAGNYTVTLTVTDNEGTKDTASKSIMIVLRPESPVIDLYNQKGGQGPNEPSENFAPREIVELTALLTYNGDPVEYKLVGFDVRNAIGEVVLDRSDMTDANGLATINFTIRGECLPEIFGTWTALAVASVAEQTVSDTLTFKVRGPLLDVYTQKPEPYSGKGFDQPSDAFAPQEEVILYAEVHYNCEPVEYKLVAFEVTDPAGETIIYRSNVTDEYGIATTRFRLASNATFGTYSVLAIVEVLGQHTYDTLSFKVGWIIEITKVETMDQYGNPKNNFTRGEHIYFNITVQNIAFTSKEATIIVVVYDECGVPIGLVTLQNWVIGPGRTEIFIIDLQIPKWAYIGVAAVYANAYTNLPTTGGVPYCPEASIEFLITPP
jgi:PKD repeat protein